MEKSSPPSTTEKESEEDRGGWWVLDGRSHRYFPINIRLPAYIAMTASFSRRKYYGDMGQRDGRARRMRESQKAQGVGVYSSGMRGIVRIASRRSDGHIALLSNPASLSHIPGLWTFLSLRDVSERTDSLSLVRDHRPRGSLHHPRNFTREEIALWCDALTCALCAVVITVSGSHVSPFMQSQRIARFM